MNGNQGGRDVGCCWGEDVDLMPTRDIICNIRNRDKTDSATYNNNGRRVQCG